ncbi:MAG: 2-amino-4-hydroxy-6-hydroxymethyldihydropteridine diphosphokinase [Desulfobulbaceae bacterium DB1]|nr:MAG: 2-amino-4-hydroxy-6-hydroxymethyldihydropteridine diphosphokinase [Desulfobulbaceae bacterium DB1]
MARAVIGLGSNLGDGRENLLAAWKMLGAKGGRSIALSSPFLTEPVEMESNFFFTNAVGVLETTLPPLQLLAVMHAVEAEFGRDRAKGKDRTVDLDLLFYDELVLETDELVLPHPRIAARRFVLAPLAEIAPDLIHPLLRRTTAAMLRELDDAGGVTPMEWQRK